MAVQPFTDDGKGVASAGEECFLSTYRHYAGELFAAVAAAEAAAAQDAGSDWRDRAESALSTLLRALAERPDVARMLLIEVGAAGAEALAERDRVILRLGCLIGQDALGRAEPTTPGLLLRNVAGSIVGLIYAWVLAGRTGELEQLLPACTYLALVALEGPGSAAARAGLLETSMVQG